MTDIAEVTVTYYHSKVEGDIKEVWHRTDGVIEIKFASRPDILLMPNGSVHFTSPFAKEE